MAQKFPETKFAIIDVDQAFVPGTPANVQGLLFREEEVGYLVGYLAGLEEKRRAGKDVISAVGGMKEPPVDRFIAGYFAGRRRPRPGSALIHDYSQDWDDQAKCKELALNQIARGSNVIFQVAGGCGLGALNAAEGEARLGIGVDADQSFLGDHPHERAERRRCRRLPDHRVDSGRQLDQAAATPPSGSRRTASAGQGQRPTLPQEDVAKSTRSRR